jgi:hypothetical protein
MNDCGPSSQCKTKKCKCKEKNLDCKPNCQSCKCNINKCSNNKNNENKNEILSKNDMAALITKEIRLSVTNKKDQVFSFRNNLDIYTNKEKDQILNPQVDHIVEDQIVGHAAAYILKNESFVPYLRGLEECLNLKSLENYNVTFSEINGSKGAIIKSYLRDNLNKGYPLRALIKPESHFGIYDLILCSYYL